MAKMVPQSGNMLYDHYDEDVNGQFIVFDGSGNGPSRHTRLACASGVCFALSPQATVL